ncbi:hypothetical protein D3C79_750870 [compost metagenome]
MKAQEELVVEITQEVTALDHLRREVDQRHGVKLALARYISPRRRHIEHRQQFTVRVEHRAGRAGQPGMAATKVLILMNGHRLTFDQAGTDAIGAFARLAPVGTEPQPGAFENASLAGRGDAVEDHPTGVGEQHGMAGAGKLLVQAVHLVAGDLQHLLQALAAFQHAAVFEHGRRHALGRVQVIVLEATQPGTGDRRVATGALGQGLALGHGEYLPGVPAEVIALHFLLFSADEIGPASSTRRRNAMLA